MDFVYELLRAGTTQNDSDSGSEVARKFNDNFQKVQEKFSEIDQSLNKEKITGLIIGGLSQPIDENGNVEVPIAGLQNLGVIKSSDGENKIKVDTDGTAEVVSLNINKLVQTDGDYLVLDGNLNKI